MADRMREVELVEAVDESATLPAGPEAGGAVPAGRSWARRHARWLVPSVVVALLALVGTQLVADAREQSRLEALAAIPGVVRPTGPDIGVIWRADPDLATVMQGGTSVDGLLIGGKASSDHGIDLVALSIDTGEVRWTTPVQVPAAHVTPDGGRPTSGVGCVPVEHGDRSLVGCVSQQYGDDIVGLPESGVWAVDPADGSIVWHAVVPGGAGVAFADGAAVVATRIAPDGDGPPPADAETVRWRTTATDLVSGAARWTTTSPVVDVLSREDYPNAASATGTASLQTFEDELLLAVDLHAWILRDDGHVVRDIPLGPGAWIQGVRSGVYLDSTYSSAEAPPGTLRLADGSSLRIDETAAWLAIDDGSAPGMLFTVSDGAAGPVGLTGREASTGKRLWHRDQNVTAGILLDGVLYLSTDKAIQAVDATTGRIRWSTRVDFQPQQLDTDGRYLLVPGLGVSLRAYALSNGRFAWSKDLLAEAAGDRDPIYVEGFQWSWHVPRLYVWMDDGGVAVLG
ncbi:PQQ-binding-like beta-propeller repeat protein [Cellulomonas sp. URHD0024]|uniref:outer membrane protein assembly factor BamB family protein n=1 Tax=Cellulomonas sp. URHD0024 TaxID=1302620 RepID=UPI0003FCC49D|nr:PQQ-binding-like beta-propeller repeat protein [Cellulomonas sp. URHD0024]